MLHGRPSQRFRLVGPLPSRHPELRRLNGRGIRKTAIAIAQGLKRSNHEASAHDQYERERHLDNDQNVARSAPLAGRARPTRCAERGYAEVWRVLEHRDRAEQQRRCERGDKRKCEHRGIDGNLLQPRQISRGKGEQNLDSDACQPPTEHAACSAQSQALHEQLPRDSVGSGAERGAHRELLSPCVGPYEHEVRDVGARDEQHGADRAHEHPQRARDAADQVVLQRTNGRRDPPVPVRLFRVSAARHQRPSVEPNRQHPRDVRSCLVPCHSGFESPEHLIVEPADGPLGNFEVTDGENHVGLCRVDEPEVARHDADDARPRRLRIDGDLPPQDSVVAAELPLPERIGKDDGRWSLGRRSELLRREPTTAQRLHAERLQSVIGDHENIHARRLTGIGQRREVVGILPQADAGKRPVLVPVRKVHRVRRIQILDVGARSAVADPHELVRARIRQRLDQHGIDDAEDRRGRAEPKREREHRCKRERGPPQRVRAARGADRDRSSRR